MPSSGNPCCRTIAATRDRRNTIVQVGVDGIASREFSEVGRKVAGKLFVQRLTLSRVHTLSVTREQFVFAQDLHRLCGQMHTVRRAGIRGWPAGAA